MAAPRNPVKLTGTSGREYIQQRNVKVVRRPVGAFGTSVCPYVWVVSHNIYRKHGVVGKPPKMSHYGEQLIQSMFGRWQYD